MCVKGKWAGYWVVTRGFPQPNALKRNSRYLVFLFLENKWCFKLAALAYATRLPIDMGCSKMSEAESKRAAEHKHVVAARRASLRSLRNRKSLAACGSSMRSFHAAEQNTLHLRKGATGASVMEDNCWDDSDAKGSKSSDGARARRPSGAYSISWSNLEEGAENGAGGASRLQPAHDDALNMHPVRSALPMINQASFKSRSHGLGHA